MRELKIKIEGEDELCGGCKFVIPASADRSYVSCKLFGCQLDVLYTVSGPPRHQSCLDAEIEPAAPRLRRLMDTANDRIKKFVPTTKMPLPDEPKGKIAVEPADVERLAEFVVSAIKESNAVESLVNHIAGKVFVDSGAIDGLDHICDRWDEVVEKRDKLAEELTESRKRTAREPCPSPMIITTLGRIAELVDPEGAIGECLGDYGNGDFEELFGRVYTLVNSMARIALAVDPKIDNYDDLGNELVDQICALAPELAQEQKRVRVLLDLLVETRSLG